MNSDNNDDNDNNPLFSKEFFEFLNQINWAFAEDTGMFSQIEFAFRNLGSERREFLKKHIDEMLAAEIAPEDFWAAWDATGLGPRLKRTRKTPRRFLRALQKMAGPG